MDRYAQLADMLKGRNNIEIFFTATVVSVQGNTCTIDADGLQLDDVRLKPTTETNDTELLLTPAIGSSVLVGSLSGTYSNLFIIQSDAVDKVFVRIGEMSFQLTKDGIVLNDGKLGGLVKVRDIVKKLNLIEQDLNALKTAFKNWTTAPSDGGAALKLSAASWYGSNMIETTVGDIENGKVKQ